MIFLPQMDEVGFGTGASEQNINSCLKWSKGVQMGPKGCQHQLTPPYFDQLSERHQPLYEERSFKYFQNFLFWLLKVCFPPMLILWKVCLVHKIRMLHHRALPTVSVDFSIFQPRMERDHLLFGILLDISLLPLFPEYSAIVQIKLDPQFLCV